MLNCQENPEIVAQSINEKNLMQWTREGAYAVTIAALRAWIGSNRYPMDHVGEERILMNRAKNQIDSHFAALIVAALATSLLSSFSHAVDFTWDGQ